MTSHNSTYGNHITRRGISTMTSTSRRRSRARQDHISISNFSDQSSDTETISPGLHWMSGEARESCYASRLVDDDSPETICHDRRLTKVETLITSEVADWWQSQQLDEFWVPRNKQHRKMPPTANQILLQLKTSFHTCTTAPMVTADGFELLLHAIALQLLASCYTILPATNACHLPLFQQRNRPTPVTALRLHTQYRFEPAAGHHARASSETASWPGLYAGPATEDNAAEVVTLQRRQRRNSHYVPCFAVSGWTDGPSVSEDRHIRGRLQSSPESSSSFKTGFFSRLICQTSTSKNPRRKYNTLFMSLATRRGRPLGTLRTRSDLSKPHHSRPKALQDLTSQAVQRIPSSVRLRRTQSAPRTVLEESSATAYTSDSRRHSSNPSIGSPLNYPFEIPEIHRTSATPAHSQKGKTETVRLCGRGDLITGDDNQRSTSMYSSEASLHSDQNHTLSLPAQIPEILSPISPRDTSKTALREPNDYFASVHAATHVHDIKDYDIDEEDDLTTERENAGPSIDECPLLQKIFAKMNRGNEGDMSDDISDESDLERNRKRKSMWVDPGSPSREFVARLERQRQETRLIDQ